MAFKNIRGSENPLENARRDGPASGQILQKRTHTVAQAIDLLNNRAGTGAEVGLYGRVMRTRDLGGIGFAMLQDSSGSMQLIFDKSNAALSEFFSGKVLKGDIFGVGGNLCQSPKGAPSLNVTSMERIVKPELVFDYKTDPDFLKHHGYISMLMDPAVRKRFEDVAMVFDYTRQALSQEGFVEFHTPILKEQYDGGTSKPFIARSHSLRKDMFLRVSSELELTMLLVGGYEKVFEVARVFRNEGVSRLRGNEFTLIGFGEAFAGYGSAMSRFERTVKEVCDRMQGRLRIEKEMTPQGSEWPRIAARDAVLEHCGVDLDLLKDSSSEQEKAMRMLSENSVQKPEALARRLIVGIAAQRIRGPVFITDFPSGIASPTSRRTQNPAYAEWAKCFVSGVSIGEIHTIETNPEVVKAAFARQDDSAEVGYSHMQNEYLEALRYGLPPSATGCISTERLAMIVTGSKGVDEVVPFRNAR